MNKFLVKKLGFGVMFLVLFAFASCSNSSREAHKQAQKMQEENYSQTVSDELIYTKDARTNLCFAAFGVKYANALMTNVPCTEEVEKLIGK